MNAFSRSAGACLLSAAALGPQAATAAPKTVEPFDASSWKQLTGSLQQPAAVVFTTTDCVYCPAAIQSLAGEIHKHKSRASLIAVVMDSSAAELTRDPHYRPADRLFAFEGQLAALRYSVNPEWRGMTPYVALLAPGRPVTWVLGRPSIAQVEAWLASNGARSAAK